MRCPANCDAALVMSERHGVEIDYCPECRGVWLDRGELDKILERAGGEARVPASAPAPAPAAAAPPPPPPDRGYDREYDRGYPPPDMRSHPYRDPGSDYPRGYGKRKKRGSFLEEIFDF